jgi:LmbE family N-acetylglucosaminyl deacetylase
MKVLVIAAHPDDEVLGLGGTLIRHVKDGDEVFVAMMTDGCSGVYDKSKKAVLEKSLENCRKVLGVKKIFKLGFDNQMLDVTPLLKMSQAISNVITEVRPERVYLHYSGDVNQDHTAVYNAGLIATRPFASDSVNEVLIFETPSSTEANLTEGSGFNPDYFVNIEKEIDKKIEAFSNYKTEIKDFPHPRSKDGLLTLARYRGMQSRLKYAEGFKTLWRRKN